MVLGKYYILRPLLILVLLCVQSIGSYASYDSELFHAIGRNNCTKVKELLKDVANKDSFNSENLSYTPLEIAVHLKKVEIIGILLDAHADPNYYSSIDRIPLIVRVVASGCDETIDMVTHLLLAQAQVNARDESGKTALIYAALFGSPELINLLLAAGADMSIIDNDGFSTLKSAYRPEIVALLEQWVTLTKKWEDELLAAPDDKAIGEILCQVIKEDCVLLVKKYIQPPMIGDAQLMQFVKPGGLVARFLVNYKKVLTQLLLVSQSTDSN